LGWNPSSGDQPGGGVVGTVQLNLNNFSTKRLFGPRKNWGHMYPAGDDQKLNLALQMNGSDYQKVAFSFLEPWLGGKKPHSLGISTSYSRFSDLESNYKNRIFSASIDHGRKMSWPDDYFRSYTSLNYKYYDVTNPEEVFSNSFIRSDGTAEPTAFINQISLRQTFTRNSLDSDIFPKSGSQLSLSIEATPPYSVFSKKDYSQLEPAEKFNLLEYHKWTFNSSWYWRLMGDLVLNAKIQAGYLGTYNKSVGASPFERFYLGGSGIANGFTLDGRDFIPLRGYDDNSLDNGGTGYSMYNRFVLELRMPITLRDPMPVWLVGFAEAGNGYDGIKDYNPFRLKRSVGIGIRAIVPAIGLFGVDYGYGFDNEDGNGGKQFHLILGKEF
jgi:outer membrane protein insertion porin family